MNAKYTVGLLVVFLALAAAAYYAGRDRTPVDLAAGTATATPSALFELDPTSVQEVLVDGEGGDLTLARAAGGWNVNGQPANDTVDGMVERLAKPVPVRALPSDRDPDTYGFAKATLTVTLKTQDGTEKVLVFGDEAAVDANVYVRLGDSGTIYLFSNGDWNTLKGWLTDPPYRPTATAEAESTPGLSTPDGTADATDATPEGTPEETAAATATSEAGPPQPETSTPAATSQASPTPKPTPAEPAPPPTEPPTAPTAEPTLDGATP